MDVIDEAMRQAVLDKVFPGAQLLVSRTGKILFHRAYGKANLFSGRTVTRHTIYDLASLTKPLATALAVMLLIQEEKLRLDQSLASIIPNFANTPKAEIQFRHLLAHTSGLPDYRPYYLDIRQLANKDRKSALREKLIQEPLISRVGGETRYSDIGFMILEWMVETLTGTPLDQYVKRKIYRPLEIADLFFIAHDRLIPEKQYAATEVCPWRKKLLEGAVHDDNAYVMGGVAGHAGLFGTAEAVHGILLELLRNFHGEPSGKIFSPELVRIFLNKENSAQRCLGFDVPSPVGSSCGEMLDKETTVGHLGFTGTSFWMDLRQQVIVILLTNRVHPSRDNERIKKFRPFIHDNVMKQLQRFSPV